MPVSLSLQEAALFRTIAGLLAEETQLEIGELRVRVGSQGFEMGRGYLALRSQNLIEEQVMRPGFFRRLFGAEAKRYVRLTQDGLALAGGKAAAPEGEAQSAEAPSMPVPPVLPVAARAMVPEAVAKPKAAPPAPRKKRAAPAPKEYTEVLGGTPIDHVSPARDPVRLEGLAEMLGLTGFEITPAGQMLAEKRWAEGHRDSEVAIEILLVAVAHAVHMDGLGMARLDKAVARQFFGEVEREFVQLVAAGELSEAFLAGKLEAVADILGPVEAAQPRLAAILQDPVLGVAPPAVCPDDFFVAEDLDLS